MKRVYGLGRALMSDEPAVTSDYPREARISVDELHMDPRNPRLPGAEFPSDKLAIRALVADADIDELIQSIGLAGWQDFEPPIVEEATSNVIEGNRRLAALKLLRDADLAIELGVRLPDSIVSGARPEKIRVFLVKDRKDARDFIGFKHVNGARRWDSHAKARFAADWLSEGDSIEDVSRRLGDAHNTVSRLVNGISILDQATTEGLYEKRDGRRFYFSHLYTAISHNPVRRYLDLPEVDGELLGPYPVPKSRSAQLQNLMKWLYGTPDVEPAIRTQNPDLNRLVKILSSEKATRRLEDSGDLTRAFEDVADRAALFREAMVKLAGAAENAARLASEYRKEDELLEEALGVQRSVRAILATIREIESGEDV
ncbi:MAG: hypothetical protein WBC31_00275 [Candidatus Phosphoribacter baldrii]